MTPEELRTILDRTRIEMHVEANAMVTGELVEPKAVTKKLYRCVYADPPWVNPITWNKERVDNLGYPQMTDLQIIRLGGQVRQVCDPEGCHLWMWAIGSKMSVAYQAIRSWGFTEKDFVFWAHDWMRMGKVRHQGEILLYAERGNLPLLSREEINWIFTPNWRGEGSEKPDEMRQKVERCSPGPRLEMFARSKPLARASEWDTWGDTLKNDVELNVSGGLV